MAKITEFIKQSGQFLKAQDVIDAKVKEFVITGEGKVVDGEYKSKPTKRVHVEGELETKDFVFDMSKTNARLVSEKLGDDTSKWIGHILVLETYKTKTSDGKMTDAINVKEVK